MLKTIIPESVWRAHRCLVVHPGPAGRPRPVLAGLGDRARTPRVGRDRARGHRRARRRRRLGDAHLPRRARRARASLYRHEVRRAAIEAVVEAVTKVAAGEASGEPLDYDDPRVTGRPRPLIRQRERAIDWSADTTATIIRRIRAAEGHPGVLDGPPSSTSSAPTASTGCAARPGEIIAQRDGAICRATVDGAVWISHLKRAGHFKLPATRALELAGSSSTCPSCRRPCTRRRRHGLPRDLLRGARGRRLPALRLLQRRDEHRPVPAAARRLPRARATATRARSS